VLNEAKIFAVHPLRQADWHGKARARHGRAVARPLDVRGEASLARLRMCADCRVVDLMTHETTVDIRDV
jgi:hypothetical protein